MYYGHMSKTEIMHSSRPFLSAIYQKYASRACENLGVSSEPQEEELSEEAYPSRFKKFTKEEQEEYVAESGISDEEYLEQFSDLMQH